MSPRHVHKWSHRFQQQSVEGLLDQPRPGRKPTFSPGVALHLVKMACELPDLQGRSLSQWDCTELARQLIADDVVEDISAQSVRPDPLPSPAQTLASPPLAVAEGTAGCHFSPPPSGI